MSMNILIISRTPWDNGNSFGNTFTNLFGGMENVTMFNICCQSGPLNSEVVTGALQITEGSLVRHLLKRKPVAKVMEQENQSNVINSNQKGSFIGSIKTTIPYVGYLVRDAIWKVGGWKKSPELAEFLKMAAPDVIYLPIYRSGYMCNFQRYIIEQLNVPVVGHITDELYYMPSGFAVSPLHYAYQASVRKKIAKLIAKCSYLEVFAENMQREYSKLFQKDCYLIGKGVDISKLSPVNYTYPSEDREMRFLYTGIIGNGRYKLLCDIADALSRGGYRARIDIYTGTVPDGKMQRELDRRSNIHLNGFVTSDKLAEIRAASDYMLHVEGADARSIYETRMSFSTKIIDYLQSGKPVFAYGSPEVNSIEVLKTHGTAIVADATDIDAVLSRLFGREIDLDEVSRNVTVYLTENRDIQKLQKGMYDRMRSLL